MMRDPLDPREALIACPDPQATRALCDALRRVHPQALLYFATAAEQARLMIGTLPLSLVLADLDLASPSPTEFVAQIRWRKPSARLIVVAAHGGDDRLLPALRAGAVGFLCKQDPVDEWVAQLRKLAVGVLPLTPALARQIIRDVDATGAPLPQSQWQVLAWIAAGHTPVQAGQQVAMTEEEVQDSINRIYERVALRGAGPGTQRSGEGN